MRCNPRVLIAQLAFALGVFLSAAAACAGTGAPRVVVIGLEGAITPASADYAVRGMRKAGEEKAALIVLKLDTPGGLDSSMRRIIKAILASAVPVATYVAPDGARAASAGTYMLYASHIAAMAPATNLGAATPVNILGGDDHKAPAQRGAKDADRAKDQSSTRDSMRSKQINDAAAYIRGLAEMRGRNADWAERAVREAVSLPASEALKLKVVDVIASDVPSLLRALDGRRVTVLGRGQVLALGGASVVEVEADWRTRLLMVIADPSFALILMMIGIYGLIFEFMSPGFVLPGVLGGICLLTGLYALQLLPINYAGVLLILLGITFMVAEAFVPSFGALGIGGVAALAIGLVILIDPETAPGFDIPPQLIVGITVFMAAAVFATAYLALKSRRQPVVSGREDLFRADAVALEDFEGEGWVRVHGERWRAKCAGAIREGEHARVTGVSGLMLTVEKN